MLAFYNIFAFLKINIKWLAMIIVVVAISFGIWKYTKLVKELAVAQYNIAQLEQNVVEKEATIKFEQARNEISDNIINAQNEITEKLRNDLEDVTEDLPEDNSNIAPKSIRETLKRLRDR